MEQENLRTMFEINMDNEIERIEAEERLERCGYCGNYIQGGVYLTAEELSTFTKEQIESAPTGYCTNAHAEHEEQNPEPYNPTPREMYEQGVISKSEYENL